jgi:hypothetical protein
MNERIGKLRLQACKWASENVPIGEYENASDEKFAEMIVKECLKEIKDMIVDESELLYPNNKQTTEFVNDRLLDAYDNIKEHFGVEE